MIARVIVFFSACLLFQAVDRAFAHELEDNFVEKAVEVVIRDNKATLKYYVGVSDSTAKSYIEKWTGTKLSDDQTINVEVDFAEQLAKRLVESVELKINGTQRKLRPADVSNPAKHHFTCVAKLEFELDNGANEIQIVDKEFQEIQSAARYSLKALGSTMLVNSNVAPIIIRAKRHELNADGANRRSELCTINATVATTTPVSNPDNLRPD